MNTMPRDELKALIRTAPNLRVTLAEIESQLQLAERRAARAAADYAAEIEALHHRRAELKSSFADIEADRKQKAAA